MLCNLIAIIRRDWILTDLRGPCVRPKCLKNAFIGMDRHSPDYFCVSVTTSSNFGDLTFKSCLQAKRSVVHRFNARCLDRVDS